MRSQLRAAFVGTLFLFRGSGGQHPHPHPHPPAPASHLTGGSQPEEQRVTDSPAGVEARVASAILGPGEGHLIGRKRLFRGWLDFLASRAISSFRPPPRRPQWELQAPPTPAPALGPTVRVYSRVGPRWLHRVGDPRAERHAG